MKKNFKKKLIISSLILLFIFSNFVNATNDTSNSINYNSKSQIKIDFAKKIASIKINELGYSDDFKIDNIEIINDDYSKELFFICRLIPKGYIVISKDNNLPPIIAYSFKSNITENEDFFIEFLKDDITQRLKNIENLPEYIIHERNSMWDSYLFNDKENFKLNYEQWPPEGTSPTDGWIVTTWSQNSPYNDFCPIDPDSGDRSVAGCPAVAMSQILNYHKTINNVFFDDNDDYYHNYIYFYTIDDDHEEYDFPSFPELNDYLNVLDDHYKNNIDLTDEDKASLNFACGIAAKQVYTPQVSGTFGVDQAYDAYIKFNCNNIELLLSDDPYLYDRIIQNIKEAYPVHLAVVTPAWDSGHNLIIDGYNTNDYYHLNFGWNGQLDTWYNLPDDMPYGLTVIEGAIVDILYDENASDLNCIGKLNWVDVKAGEILYGNFSVENIGALNSSLNWSIESFPEWGTWEISPSQGRDLKPEDEPINVEVKVVAPDRKGKEFSGGIKIVNMDHRGDNFYIQVSLTTPNMISNINTNNFKLIERYMLLIQEIFDIVPI